MQKYVEIKKEKDIYLRGYLNLPTDASEIVIMFHGFTGNKTEHGRMFKTISEALAEKSIATLRFDFFGNGESDGKFYEFTFNSLIEDAKMIVEYASDLKQIKKINFLGYSMGGAIASHVACLMMDKISKLVLWSPAGNIKEIIENYYRRNPKLENGNADYLGFQISANLMESFKALEPYKGLDVFKNPVLVVHGKKDLAVNCEFGEKYSLGFSDSNLQLIDNAGHGYDNFDARKELFDKTISFLTKKN